MKVICEKCKKEYFLDDGKIKGDIVKVKCTSCNHHFKIRRLASLDVSKDEKKDSSPWRVKLQNGKVYGFNDPEMIKSWIAEGRVGDEDKISHKGSAWQKITDFDEFAELFSGKGDDREDTITASGDFLDEDIVEEEEISPQDVTRREVIEESEIDIDEDIEEIDEDMPDSFGGETTISFQDKGSTGKRIKKEIEESLIIDEDSFIRKKIESIKEKKRDKRKIVYILLTIFVIGSLGIGAFYFKNRIIKRIKPIYSRLEKKIFSAKKEEVKVEEKGESNIEPSGENPTLVDDLINFHTIASHNRASRIIEKYANEHPEMDLFALKGQNLALFGVLTKDNKIMDEARELATLSLSRNGSDRLRAVLAIAIYYIFSHSKVKERDLANKYIEQAIKIKPNDPLVYNVLGMYYRERALALEAKEQFKKAIKLDENNIIAHRELLSFAESEEDVAGIAYHKAILEKAVEPIIKKYPDLSKSQKGVEKDDYNSPDTSHGVKEKNKITREVQVKRTEQNIANEEQLQKKTVSDDANKKAKTHFAKGSYYYIKGMYEEARKEYESSISYHPGNPNYHFRLALTLEALYITDGAIKEYEKAVKLDSKMAQAYRKMGDLYSQLGNKPKSIDAYKKYLKLEPNGQDKEEVKGLIQEMNQ